MVTLLKNTQTYQDTSMAMVALELTQLNQTMAVNGFIREEQSNLEHREVGKDMETGWELYQGTWHTLFLLILMTALGGTY